MIKKQNFVDRCFKDKSGKLALTATPNIPIIIWAAASVAARLVSYGMVHKALSVVAFGAIFIWAVLEITQGVNYFRRTLGLAVLIFTIYNRLT